MLHDNSNVANKLAIALISNLYKQAIVGFYSSLFCGTLIFISLFENGNRSNSVIWFGILLSSLSLRLILVKFFSKTKEPIISPLIWRNLFICGVFLSGISWGLVGTSFILPASGIEQTLVLVILAGITAGSVPLLSHVRSAASAFLIPALLPLIIHLYLLETTTSSLLASAILIYLSYLLILVVNTHHILKYSIKLRLINEELVKNLSQAKIELEETNEKLEQAATHDPLTQVANRNLFNTILSKAIRHAEANQKMVALFYIDLDKFKEVNDIYGHHFGDQILLNAVDRIKNIIRDKDIISRLGGDEISVILENVKDIKHASDIAQRICESISQPNFINKNIITIHASVGISIYPIDGVDIETLLKLADNAMYYVKEHGGNNFHFNSEIEYTTE